MLDTITQNLKKQVAWKGFQFFVTEELTRKLAKNKTGDQNSQVSGHIEDRNFQPWRYQ